MSETSLQSLENDSNKSLRPRGSRKRQVHNEVERRRKDKINGWISKIAQLLPIHDCQRQSKISILEQTVDYIKLLSSEKEKLLLKGGSEVQVEEIKRLKKDLQILKEQNATYEKLLLQANISLTSLPKKPFKYDEIVQKIDSLNVKNLGDNGCSTANDVDSDVIANSSDVSVISCGSISKNVSKHVDSPGKNSKTSTQPKASSSASKVIKHAKVSPAVQSLVPHAKSEVSAAIVTTVKETTHQESRVSQENVIPIINWNETARNSTSLHAGGVTTVLSQLPVMSTSHSSTFANVCPKNIPTIIIPTGGSILQQFPEKPPNTLSIICPTTLPIIFPQVLHVPSIARNVNIASTIICPAPVNNHCSQTETALGNTVAVSLCLNTNSIVPISSNASPNARIVLPSQTAALGNVSNNANVTHQASLVTSLFQSANDQLPVPSDQQKINAVVVPDKNIIELPKEKTCNTLTNIYSENQKKSDFISLNENNKKCLPSLLPAALDSCKDKDSSTSSLDISKKESVEHAGSVKTPSLQNRACKQSSRREIRNICFNSLPSLQVLSANKIISLANQSQKMRSNVVLPLYQKAPAKTATLSLQASETKPNQNSNNICLHIDSVPVSKNLNVETSCTSVDVLPTTTSCTSSTHAEWTTTKSNFSLTVLMGDTLPQKNCNIPGSAKEIEESNVSNPVTTDQTVLQSCHISESSVNISSVNNVTFSSSSNSVECPKDTSFNVSSKSHHLCVPNKSNASKTQETPFTKPTSTNTNKSLTVCLNTNHIPASTSASVSKTNLMCKGIISKSQTTNGNIKSNCTNLNPSFSGCSEQNTEVPKEVNVLQQERTMLCPKSVTQSTASSSVEVNNVFSESIAYIAAEKEDNQNILTPIFSNNQISSLNSSVFVCAAVHENNSSHSHSETAAGVNSLLLSDSCTDLYNFQTLNKDCASSSTYSITTDLNETEKSSNVSIANVSESSVKEISMHLENKNSSKPYNKVLHLGNECSKSTNIPKKRNKMSNKMCKSNSNIVKVASGTDNLQELSNSLNKSSTLDNSNSFSKNNTPGCLHQETSNFIFTSDILARATESIFGSDMMESPQMPKKSICFSDDASNLNASSEKIDDQSFKLQYNEEVTIAETAVNTSMQKEKKNHEISEIQTHLLDDNIPAEVKTIQDLNQKQSKISRVRKAKSISDNEPPSKKMKEISMPDKQTSVYQFNQIHLPDKDDGKHSSTVLHKQVSPELQVVDGNQNVDSVEHFGNQIHLPDNNCKTPSVDAIFSLTPMLGDILKDVAHNGNLESRNNSFLASNDSQNIFSTEKNFISFNYTNPVTEDYLNLPRMYFPIIPDISAAPVVQATNVSFAHNVSLCSTQSDSLKTTETLSSSETQNKAEAKKSLQPILHDSHREINSTSGVAKQPDCVNTSELQLNNTPPKVSSNSSLLFETQNSEIHSSNMAVAQTNNSTISQTCSNYVSRDNFVPSASHNITFYPNISSNSSHIQNFSSVSSNNQNFTSSTPTVLPQSSYQCVNSSSVSNLPFSVHVTNSLNNTTFSSQSHSSKPDSLSHSLCSLLKENTNILVENRTVTNGSSTPQSVSSSTNITQSKYSALSLISDQTSYSEPVSSSVCHSQYVQSNLACTQTSSSANFTPTATPCGRNQRTSLSYSAESLLQTSCANTEKNKNKASISRYPQRTAEKKTDRINVTNMHNMTDTNIFMPVSNCDLNIQNVPLVPLPPVTSFQNFPSSYTICETAPSTTIFNTVTRTHDIPLALSNDNFLSHMNLSVESQILSNRHEVASTVPKPHANITLPFENHGALYSNCNFLPHVKPTLENSRPAEPSACFQPSSFNNNYSQQSQKPNCCHFTHRTLSTNSELAADISLPVGGPSVTSFHADKSTYQANRPALQTTFSQSNSNFVGNFFYNAASGGHDGTDVTPKLPNMRISQETFVPEGIRQNISDPNAGITFNNRKNVVSNRSKSKKIKSMNSNEANLNQIPNSIANFCTTQDSACNKTSIPCVPNGYFKNATHSVIALPSQLPCSQAKISENASTSVIPNNPSFNSVLHQQGDNFLSLNFQPPNFTVSPLPRPPTQPLSCACLTTPIISHTFSSTAHPVPNFNLSNILPDMGCSGNQASLSPVKFPAMNHALPSSTTQCQTSSSISNSAHIVSHQSCGPSLYPPHPPIVRGTLNPILGHNAQSLNDNQVPLVGTGGTPIMPQNTFSATQNPTFRNVIHSLTFPRTDR